MELKVNQRFRSNSNPEISIDEIEGAKESLFRVHSCQPSRINGKPNLSNVPLDTTDNYNQSDNDLLISSSESINSPDNTNKINGTFYWTGIYLCIIVTSCVLLSFPVILLPNHDQIKHPECWWESLYSVLLSFALSLVLSSFQDYRIVFKSNFKISSEACIRTFILVSVTFVIPFCIIYLIWTVGAGYNPPIPFIGIGGYSIYMATITAIWFQVPSYWRTQKSTQRKFRAYLFYYMWCSFISLQYNTSSSMFAKHKKGSEHEDWQWVIGILLLILRELNSGVLDKLINKAVGFVDIQAKMTAIIYINCQHSFYVAIAIGDAATLATTYILLIGDFALNIYISYRIIQMHKFTTNQVIANEDRNNEKQETTLMLVTIEAMEILVPIAYSVSFLVAYYGPNGEVLGNVNNECWQYKKIDDVGEFILSVFQMFFIDLGSAIVGGLLLWNYCSINMLDVGSEMICCYWPLIALKFAHRMTMVRMFNL